MRILCHNHHKGWYKSCETIENIINNIPCPTTGFTPSELMTGKPPQQLVIKAKTTICRTDTALSEEEKCKIALERIIKKSEIRKGKVRKGNKKWIPEIGDEVLVRNFCLSSAQRKLYKRLNLLYKGPFKIRKIFGQHTYELVDDCGKVYGKYHINFLKPYCRGTNHS